jgi:hypothetical protein
VLGSPGAWSGSAAEAAVGSATGAAGTGTAAGSTKPEPQRSHRGGHQEQDQQSEDEPTRGAALLRRLRGMDDRTRRLGHLEDLVRFWARLGECRCARRNGGNRRIEQTRIDEFARRRSKRAGIHVGGSEQIGHRVFEW